MANIILLGGGIEALPIIQRVKELGHRAIVVDGDPDAPAWEIADRCSVASCYNSEAAIRDLKNMGENYDAVLPAATDTPHVATAIREAFGLPGMGMESAALSIDKYEQKLELMGISKGVPIPAFKTAVIKPINNKFKQKQALAMADIPIPMFGLVADPLWFAGPESLAVFKPPDSRGGRGVIRLLPGVDPAWAYAEAVRHSPTSQVMVEQWLDGPQLSTESIVQDGRVLFTAVGLRNYARLDEFAPYVIEDGFDEPYHPGWPIYHYTSAHGSLNADTDALIESACRALGWYQSGAGTVKGDLVIHDGKVYVIELAARLSGGFFASHGHPLTYGVDFVGAAIKAALGYTLEEPKPYARGFVSQRYVFPSPEDIGKTVEYVPFASSPNDSPVMTWNIKPGDVIKPVTCHPARWGQALATGRTPDEARTRAEAAVAAMKAVVALR